MNLFENWLSNLFVAGITGISIYFFTKILHPYIQGVLQKAPNLTGRWEGFDSYPTEGELPTSQMEIKQLGTNISATVRRRSNNRERVFKYKGTISSGQVLLIWKETIGNGYNMGTMTLLLSGDLMTLQGKTTYHHHDTGTIISNDKIYRRIN